MPHLKGAACRIRVHSQHSPIGGVGELCPDCGSLLEPVQTLSELVGLQQTQPQADAFQQPSATSRWLDDGGAGLDAVAVAMALPTPQLPDR